MMLLLLYKIFGMILQVVNEILIFKWLFKNRGRKNRGSHLSKKYRVNKQMKIEKMLLFLIGDLFGEMTQVSYLLDFKIEIFL